MRRLSLLPGAGEPAMPLIATVAHRLCGHLSPRSVASGAAHGDVFTCPASAAPVQRPRPTFRAVRIPRDPGNYAVGGVVVSKMPAFGFDQLKIVRVVVESVMVNMVDHLFNIEQPPNLLLHHEPVSHDPATLRGVRMLWRVLHAILLPPERPDLLRPDRRGLACPYPPPVSDPDRMQAGLAAYGRSGALPANNWRAALGAWEHGGWACFRHGWSIPEDYSERKTKQQAEWLTLNRPPAWTVPVQPGLFG